MEEEKEKDMTPILLEDLGMRYPTENSKGKARFGRYQCQYCGKEFVAIQQSIKSGDTKSCGCLAKKGNNTSHGLYYHPLYKTWGGMYHRCYNEKNPKYKHYGERGIQICERWLDVKNFIEDMYPSFEEGLTLDRIDVDGNYEPDNCRWATLNTQQYNTRELRITNTSGYRGVSWHKGNKRWTSMIMVENKQIYLGSYKTSLDAAKAYERYVRLNNLEHNFTPALTEEEIKDLELKQKEIK